MKSISWFIREWRIGWNQGVINRAEATLARLGDKPHRPGDCAGCRPVNAPWSASLLTMHHGTCPRCHQRKFIGHGPLCGDCYDATTSRPTP